MNGRKKEEFKAAIVCYLLSVFIFYIGFSFSLILVALPFVLAYSVARGGGLKGGTAAVLSLITGYFLSAHASYLFAAAFLPAAFAAGLSIRSKKRMLYGVIITSAAALAGAALAIYVLSLLSGLSVIDYIVNYFGAAMKTQGESVTLSMYQIVRYPDLLTGAITQEALNATSAPIALLKMQDMIRETLNESLVSMIGVYSLLGGLLYYIIPRAIAKNAGMDVIKTKAFSDLSLPRYFWLAFALSWIAALLGENAGLKSFDVLEPTVYTIYSFVFSVQALCFLDFMYKRRGMNPGARVLLHILAVVIFGYYLAFLGLVENILNIRRRMDERREKN